MAELSGPYEFLDLSDGASATIQVNSALEGEATIFPVAPTARHVAQHMAQNGLSTAPPAGNPIGVKIQIVRLFGTRLDRPGPEKYWDVSSRTLNADLLARFAAGVSFPITFRFTAHGVRPTKRYSVEVLS